MRRKRCAREGEGYEVTVDTRANCNNPQFSWARLTRQEAGQERSSRARPSFRVRTGRQMGVHGRRWACGIAVLDFVRRSISLEKRSSPLPLLPRTFRSALGRKAPVSFAASGGSFLLLVSLLADNTARNTLVRKCCVGRRRQFLSSWETFRRWYRLSRVHAREWAPLFFAKLHAFKSRSRKYKRNRINAYSFLPLLLLSLSFCLFFSYTPSRARVSTCRPPSRAILFFSRSDVSPGYRGRFAYWNGKHSDTL